MFDRLLGRKFTATCKHAIKYIQKRLKPIRNRKQAVVNILRKDIADLLRSGNEGHAFGRMDGLIVEMNRLACYDMIQKFCENVLMQVPSLQKQRECPEEDREALSTLIFAAARFPDLPELCELRHVFTTRYGSALETYVNSEFKEKSASRAFSVSIKLCLMKDIAREFSVNWDPMSSEYKIIKNDHPKMGDTLQDNKSVLSGRKDGMLKHVVTEAKDTHIISHELESPRKTKIQANNLKNISPASIDSSFPHPLKPEKIKGDYSTEDWQRKNDLHIVNPRVHKPFGSVDPEGKMAERHKTKDGSRARSKVPLNREGNGTAVEEWVDDDIDYKRSSRACVGPNSVGQEGYIIGKSKSKDEHKVTNVASFVQRESNGIGTKESQNIVYTRTSRDKMDNAAEWRQATGREKLEDNGKPTKVSQRPKPEDVNNVVHEKSINNVVHEKSTKCGQDSDLAAKEEQMVEPQKTKNRRAFHLIPPPYVKPTAGKVGGNTEHAKPPSRTTCEGVLDASDKSIDSGYEDLPKEELAVDDDNPKPRSVRRKHHKQRDAQEIDDNIHGDKPVFPILRGQRKHSSRRNASAPLDDKEEIAMDRLLMHYSNKGMPEQQPGKHRTKTQTDSDNGAGKCQTNGAHQISKPECVIDNGEGRQHQTNERYRIPKAGPVQPPPAHFVQDGEAVVHQSHGRHRVLRSELMHPPERAISLPPGPVTPKEAVKGPPRVMSMQPDPLSPSGGRAHPKLPDYEEFVAVFMSLRGRNQE